MNGSRQSSSMGSKAATSGMASRNCPLAMKEGRVRRSTLSRRSRTPSLRLRPDAIWASSLAAKLNSRGMCSMYTSSNRSSTSNALRRYGSIDKLKHLNFSTSWLTTNKESPKIWTSWTPKSNKISKPMISASYSAWLLVHLKSSWNE